MRFEEGCRAVAGSLAAWVFTTSLFRSTAALEMGLDLYRAIITPIGFVFGIIAAYQWYAERNQVRRVEASRCLFVFLIAFHFAFCAPRVF